MSEPIEEYAFAITKSKIKNNQVRLGYANANLRPESFLYKLDS